MSIIYLSTKVVGNFSKSFNNLVQGDEYHEYSTKIYTKETARVDCNHHAYSNSAGIPDYNIGKRGQTLLKFHCGAISN